MKILYVQDSLGTGGAERSNAELWYFLKEKNFSCRIIVLEHRKEGIEQEILDSGFEVDFLKPANFVAQAWQIANIINLWQPDIVHSVLLKSTWRVRLAKRFTSFIHVESLVNCTYDEIRAQDPEVNRLGLFFYKIIDRLSHFKGTDNFIAITQEVERHHEKHLRISPVKTAVIYRGRKKNIFLENQQLVRLELRKEFNFHREDIIFVHVGRQEFQKGHLNLLKAIKLFDHDLSSLNVKFLFCGRKGNASSEITGFLNRESIKTEILFLGHRPDVNRILAASDVFVFPSLYEGLGGSLIEAQAAALPVICSDLKVFKEVIIESENALVFPKSDETALGKHLLTLAKSPEKRKVMGEKSLVNFFSKFRLEEVNNQLVKYYNSLIS